MKLILSAALAVLFLVSSNTQADALTGCLNSKDQLTKVAIGPAPASPCKASETQVSLGGTGPQGPAGDDGANGTNGLDGQACWDLNNNGIGDASEDADGNGVVNVLDCIGVAVAGAEVFELVGVSDNTFQGDGGHVTMSRDCYDTFTDSRMCTSVEIIRTVNPPDLTASPSLRAWVQPTIVAGAAPSSDGASKPPEFVDAVGIKGTDLSCSGWSTNSGAAHGLTLLIGSSPSVGAFEWENCGPALPVTCCAPVQ